MRATKRVLIGSLAAASDRASFAVCTVTPSISVCDADCKSHYFITRGQVEWMPAFSEAMAASVMRHQIARHAVHDEMKLSWVAKIRRAIARAFAWLGSVFRI